MAKRGKRRKKDIKTLNLDFVRDHLSVREVALENGYEVVDFGDFKILEHKETRKTLILSDSVKSIDEYFDPQSKERGDILDFVEKYLEVPKQNLNLYFETTLDPIKIYDHNYTPYSKQIKETNKVKQEVSAAAKIKKQEKETKEVIEKKEILLQNNQNLSPLNLEEAIDKKEAKEIEKIKKDEKETILVEKEASTIAKDIETIKDFDMQILHDGFKIPENIIKDNKFTYGVGFYHDEEESAKEVKFKLRGEEPGRLIFRETTNLETGQKKYESIYEGNKDGIWAYNEPKEKSEKIRPLTITNHPIEAMSICALHPETSKTTTFACFANMDLNEKNIGEMIKLNKDINGGKEIKFNDNIKIASTNDVKGQIFAIEAKCKLGGLKYLDKSGFLNLKTNEKLSPIKVERDNEKGTLTVKCLLPNLKSEDNEYALDLFKRGLFSAKIDTSLDTNNGNINLTMTIDTDLANLSQLNKNLSHITGIHSQTPESRRWNNDLQNHLAAAETLKEIKEEVKEQITKKEEKVMQSIGIGM